MAFKYAAEHALLAATHAVKCPQNGTPITTPTPAYRFVREPEVQPGSNHIPVGVTNPRRINDLSDYNKCSSLGLSCYTSLPAARDSYAAFIANNRKFDQLVGGHIAGEHLQPGDGEVTTPNHTGHFDLHEYAGCDLRTRLTMIVPAIVPTTTQP